MFSANENLQLRKYKRQIVEYVEATIPDDALDAGVQVMVMQVNCRDPGCVPIETAIVIIFPHDSKMKEWIPGLSQSHSGGSYKTKVLKPMSAVTQDDVLEALPPAFKGGLRSMERLVLQARDVMLAQITQLMGSDDSCKSDRRILAECLQQALQDYIDRDCVPPEIGEGFLPFLNEKLPDSTDEINDQVVTAPPITELSSSCITPSTIGIEDNADASNQGGGNTVKLALVNSSAQKRQQIAADRVLLRQRPAAGIGIHATRRHHPESWTRSRRLGCPCCSSSGGGAEYFGGTGTGTMASSSDLVDNGLI